MRFIILRFRACNFFFENFFLLMLLRFFLLPQSMMLQSFLTADNADMLKAQERLKDAKTIAETHIRVRTRKKKKKNDAPHFLSDQPTSSLFSETSTMRRAKSRRT